MQNFRRTGIAGFFMFTLVTLSACGSGSDSTVPFQDDGTPNTTSLPPATDNPGTQSPSDQPPTAQTPVSQPPADQPAIDQPSTDQPSVGQSPVDQPPADQPPSDQTPPPAGNGNPPQTSAPQTGVDGDPLVPASASGSDVLGVEDDSPTIAETRSRIGPFIKDATRSAGPPSVPQGLTLLLAAENWLEFTWEPSTDDQSVEGYEVYRDGILLDTVRGDTGYEHDYRSWLSTSYIDCNYTRYAYCENNQPMEGASHSYTVAAIDNEGMKSAQSAPAVFTLAQRSSSPVDLTGYARVFSEEFNGSGLDRTRWKTALPWGPDETINRETQYFVNTFGNNPPAYDPFVFTGETLQITGIDTPAALRSAANNKPYLSGVITTADYFKMTYGYVEMNAKLAGGDGLLSTFFLFNQDFYKNKPEIDILEYISSRPDKAYQTYHYYDSNRARYGSGEKHSSPTMETTTGIDLSNDFHTFGVLWEPGLVVWYIDGQEVRRLTGVRVSDEPMNIIAQLVIGSEWIGAPSAASIPAVLEIDYIRAWQKQ